jgi:alpha-methylacyl-CoA racemase
MPDGAAPFYRTYRCADGRQVAVGRLEPQFFAAFLHHATAMDEIAAAVGISGPAPAQALP